MRFDFMELRHRFLAILTLGACLAGCATVSPTVTSKNSRQGAYYQNDGPGSLEDKDIANIPDAVPRAEPINMATTKPYNALGRRFEPMTTRTSYKEQGEISWYGKQYHGRKTSIGEVYDMYAMTAAHPTLPLPSYVRVTNLDNGKHVVVRVNDRGPFLRGRILDLSYVAAAKLGYIHQGTARAEVEAIVVDSRGASAPPSLAPVKPMISSNINQNMDLTNPKTDFSEILPPTLSVVPPQSTNIQPANEQPSFTEPESLSSLSPQQWEQPIATLLPETQKLLADSLQIWVSRSQVSSGMLLQVGAFSQPQAANALVARLIKDQDHWPQPDIKIIRLKDNDGKFKIWLAGFRNAKARQDTQKYLQQNGVMGFFITR